ncbi:MAG: twin-arginine translocase TatA/TatE family subunit [bacterium]
MTICLPLALLGIGASELVLVLVIALILFGPKELPKIARTIGKFMAQIRSVSDEFQSQVMHIGDEVLHPKSDELTAGQTSVTTPEVPATENLSVSGEPIQAETFQPEPMVTESATVEPAPFEPVTTGAVVIDTNKETPHDPAG